MLSVNYTAHGCQPTGNSLSPSWDLQAVGCRPPPPGSAPPTGLGCVRLHYWQTETSTTQMQPGLGWPGTDLQAPETD